MIFPFAKIRAPTILVLDVLDTEAPEMCAWRGLSHVEGMDQALRILFPAVQSENISTHQQHPTEIVRGLTLSTFPHEVKGMSFAAVAG